ncbi:DUF1559 domain-containing protein [Planctomycetaceae bacterium SH139]
MKLLLKCANFPASRNRVHQPVANSPGEFAISSLRFLLCGALLVGCGLLPNLPTALAQQDDAVEQPAGQPAANQPAAGAEDDDELPSDFSGLVARKDELIAAYRQANEAGDVPLSIERLTSLWRVEKALMLMAEAELGATQVALADSYRETYQDDGGLLAETYFNAGQYAAAADTFRTVLEVARRRQDVDLIEYSLLVSLERRASRLAAASPEDQQRFQAAMQQQSEAEQLAAMTKLAQAAAMMTPALQTLREIGGNTPTLAGQFERCASWWRKSDDDAQAEKLFLIAQETYEKTIGRENQRFTSLLYNYGLLLISQERWREAEKAFAETRMIEDRLGVELKSQLMTLNELAGVYRQLSEDEKFDELVGAYRYLEARSSLGCEVLLPLLPVDAYFALALSPKAMMQEANLEHLPFEVLRSFVADNIGADPIVLETMVGFLTLPFSDDHVNLGVLIKTAANQPLELRLPGESKQAEFRGKAYTKVFFENEPEPLCHAMLRDGVYVYGNEAAVQQVLAVALANESRGERSSKLGDRILAQHGTGNALAALDLAKLQVLIQAGVEQLPPLPPPFEPLKTIPGALDSASFVISLEEAPYFTLRLQPREDAAPEALQTIINDSMESVKGLLSQQVMQVIETESPELAAGFARYLNRLMTTEIENVSPVIEDGQLVMRLDAKVGLQGPFMVGLLLPAVQAARAAAERMEGMNNLKQIGLAFHNFHDVHGNLPPRQLELPAGAAGLSWRVQLLPFLGENELYEAFHLDEPWDSEHNLTLVERMPAVFSTPGMDLAKGKTNLLTFGGANTMMEGEAGMRFSAATDGLSNTILVVEADPEQAVIWTQPVDLPYDERNPTRGLGQAREGGFNVLISDGAVRFIAADVAPEQFKLMVTRNDGEAVDWSRIGEN